VKARGPARPIVVGLVAGLVLLVLVRGFVVAVYSVPTPSMAPTLLVGDRLLVNKMAYRSEAPRRGDVIIFHSPSEAEAEVKRVIGLPGDTLVLSTQGFRLNGQPLTRQILRDVSLDADGDEIHAAIPLAERRLVEEEADARRWQVAEPRLASDAGGAWQVPRGFLFVLGDNRGASVDSRDPSTGLVSIDRVVGRVERVIYSRGPSGLRSRWWEAVP
jgi:signal peptidase I